MTQDLSASTLEAVRRNMTVMSFMIIVFFFAGGYLPSTGVAIKLPLSDIKFTNPERLLYVLWMMMAWWTYRYFALGAWSGFKEGFGVDMAKVLMKNTTTNKAVTKVSNGNDRFQAGYSLHCKVSESSGKFSIALREMNGNTQSYYDTAYSSAPLALRASAAFTAPSSITFTLPLVMILFAFGLTAHSAVMAVI